jgi:hypothetical protein
VTDAEYDRPATQRDKVSLIGDHLFERLRERKITAEDLYQLKTWRESNPDAPDGLWCRVQKRREAARA